MNEQERLSQELRNRAAHSGGHPLTFDDVKRSATKMKWQQRAAAGGVAAVVLAIGVPVGINLAGGNEARDTPQVANNNTATPTPTPAPPQGPISIDLTDAAQGLEPSTPWIQGKTLHLADGSTAQLPRADYDDVIGYRGGWLGTRFDQGDGTLDRIDAGGKVTSSTGTTYGIAESADGTEAAWGERRGDQNLIVFGIPSGHSDEEPTVEVPEDTPARVIGFSGAGEVVYEPYYVDLQYVAVVDQGGKHRTLPGALKAGGVSQETHKVSLMTSVQDDGSCWEVRDLTTGEADWKTCDYSLGAFSADGQWVLGYSAYQDGIGPRDVYVLDATTGQEALHFQSPDNAFFAQAVWDGDSSDVIASTFTDGTWQLARLTLQGEVETASDAVQGEDVESSFRLTRAQ